MSTVDIVALPVAEKLRLMESLWASLRARPESHEVSPAWHGDVLDERLRRLDSGLETTSSWPEAKERIRNTIKSA
jgi:putative addiction module component (TIGR02574 family)